MATRGSPHRTPDEAPDATPDMAGAERGALEQLLDAERDCVARLAAADRESETILDEARAAAEQREQRFARTLEEDVAELRRRLRLETAQWISETEAAARHDAARFEQISDERVATFADALLDQVFAVEAAS
jgi:hypothetical protein